MERQDYQRHVRIDPLFHWVAVPLAMLAVAASAVHVILAPSWDAGLIVGLAFVVCLLVVKLRQYATRLQDRIVRAEEGLRHLALTGKPLPSGLSLPQVIALRFASDAEFPGLCQRARKDQWNADQIKRAIGEWRADRLRV